MNRFAGTSPADRRTLIEAAIAAHRTRESDFLTLEADPEAVPEPAESDGPPPWIQYRDQAAELNLDCTDAERESIRAVVGDVGGVQVTAQASVDDAGTNLRITVPGDDGRVATVIERLLVEGFGLSSDHRLWVAAI